VHRQGGGAAEEALEEEPEEEDGAPGARQLGPGGPGGGSSDGAWGGHMDKGLGRECGGKYRRGRDAPYTTDSDSVLKQAPEESATTVPSHRGVRSPGGMAALESPIRCARALSTEGTQMGSPAAPPSIGMHLK